MLELVLLAHVSPPFTRCCLRICLFCDLCTSMNGHFIFNICCWNSAAQNIFFAAVPGFTSDIFLELECLGHLAYAFKMLTDDTLKKILTSMVSFPWQSSTWLETLNYFSLRIYLYSSVIGALYSFTHCFLLAGYWGQYMHELDMVAEKDAYLIIIYGRKWARNIKRIKKRVLLMAETRECFPK